MTRRQAENLAKGNPKIAARLKAGEYDDPPGGAPGAPGPSPGKPRAKPRKPPVSAGAPPARPRTRAQPAREQRRTSATRPPRRSRDNGQPGDPPPKRGVIRSIIDGLLDI